MPYLELQTLVNNRTMSNAPTNWRLSKKSRNIALTCLPCFAAIGLGSVSLAWINPGGNIPNPGLAAAFFGAFWGFWVLLSGYVLLLYRQYSLSIDGKRIRQVGVFSDRTFFCQNVSEIKWKRYPAGGTIWLSDQSSKLKIDLGNSTKEDRKEIIDRMRGLIAHDLQVGWEEFCQHFESAKKRTASKRSRKFLIGIFAFHAIVFTVMGMFVFGRQFVFAAILNSVMVAYLLRSAKRAKEGDADPEAANELLDGAPT